jgi:hypothetical protein
VIAAPKYGFVFLAMPKCASSAIESAVGGKGLFSLSRNPLKHMQASEFEELVAPLIDFAGYPRDSYETLCLFREPIDWLHSWWRYRTRPALADPRSARHENYTGHVTFEEFTESYIRGDVDYARVTRQAEFVSDAEGRVCVDRIFKYEHSQDLLDYVKTKLGLEIAIDHVNVSPERELQISDRARVVLRDFLAPEYAIYEGL